MADKISDDALWKQEWFRQFHSIKAALHSLRLQADSRRTANPHGKSVKEMAHWFDLTVDAFQILNTPEPSAADDGDYIPNPKGRREFLSDLKHGEVRT